MTLLSTLLATGAGVGSYFHPCLFGLEEFNGAHDETRSHENVEIKFKHKVVLVHARSEVCSI